MMFNKNQFHKTSNKKVLKKVKKQWVTVSVATLAFLGGSFYLTNTSASADTVNSTQVAQSNSTTENQSSGSSSATTTQASSTSSDVASQGSSSASTSLSASSSTTSSASVTASSVASNENSSSSLSSSDSMLSSSSSDSSDWSNSISSSDATLSNRDGDAPTASSPQNSTVQWDFYGNATDKYQAGTLAIHSGAMNTNNKMVLGYPGSYSSNSSMWPGVDYKSVKHIVFDGTTDGAVKITGDASRLFSNLNNLVDVKSTNDKNVDTSSMTSMMLMFSLDYNLSDISALKNWNVSNVTNMSTLFSGTSLTNLDSISKWDVSNVTDMSSMFNYTKIPDVNGIKDWNTGNVTNMYSMFEHTSLTDLSGLQNWDVSKVTDMSRMFSWNFGITNLKGLSKWKTNSLVNMYGIFMADVYLNDISALKDWDVSKVTDMSWAFSTWFHLTNADALSGWKTNSLVNLDEAFNGANLSSLDFMKTWDLSHVNSMNGTFFRNSTIPNINGLKDNDLSNVSNLSDLFGDLISINNNKGHYYDFSKLNILKAINNKNVFNISYFMSAFSTGPNVYGFKVVSYLSNEYIQDVGTGDLNNPNGQKYTASDLESLYSNPQNSDRQFVRMFDISLDDLSKNNNVASFPASASSNNLFSFDDKNPNWYAVPDNFNKKSLSKTVTKTINYVDSNGNVLQSPVTQQLSFTRKATYNEYSGQITYGAWIPTSNNKFDDVTSPVINGYTLSDSSQSTVLGSTIDGNGNDININVTYAAKPSLDAEATKVKNDIDADNTLTSEEKSEQKNNVDNIKSTDQVKIDSSTNSTDVSNTYNQGIKDIDGQHKPGQSLDDQKATAKANLDKVAEDTKAKINGDATLTTAEKASQSAAVDADKAASEKAIDAASNADAVNQAVADGTTKIQND
uniref:BspA family leucine-rich repeat surface protein n=1 Tax=Apilactobacillus waqarii TaxID=2851006 RepID=UPI003364F523